MDQEGHAARLSRRDGSQTPLSHESGTLTTPAWLQELDLLRGDRGERVGHPVRGGAWSAEIEDRGAASVCVGSAGLRVALGAPGAPERGPQQPSGDARRLLGAGAPPMQPGFSAAPWGGSGTQQVGGVPCWLPGVLGSVLHPRPQAPHWGPRCRRWVVSLDAEGKAWSQCYRVWMWAIQGPPLR